MINRSAIRHRLADLFLDEVESAQAVIPYQTVDFKGQSPVILIMSAGSLRPTRRLTQHQTFIIINIYVNVSENVMTADEAEDLIDLIEFQIQTCLEAHDTDDLWLGHDAENASLVDKIVIGDPYLFESIPIVFTIRG